MRTRPLSVWLSRRFGILGILVFCSGCMAVETVQGDSTVYSQSLLVTLVVGLGGLAFAVIGIGAFIEALPYAMQTSAAKRKGRKGGPKRKNGIAQIIVGGLMGAIGLVLVTYGIPSTLLSAVTVGPDSVTLKHGSFLFTSSTKTILYDSIKGFNVEEIDARGFKGRRQSKRILHLTHSGGHERIEMNSMHIAAVPKLEEAYAAYRSRDTNDTQIAKTNGSEVPSDSSTTAEFQDAATLAGTVSSTPVHRASVDAVPQPAAMSQSGAEPAPAVVAADDISTGSAVDGLTPVRNLGRMRANRFINVRVDTGLLYAEILEVFAERQLRVRYPREPARGIELVNVSQVASVQAEILDTNATAPGELIASVSDVAPGDVVLAQHGSDWYPVKVLALQPPDRVRVTWVDEPPGNHSIPLSWCCRLPANGVQSRSSVASATAPPVPTQTAMPTGGAGKGIAAGQKMEALWGNKWYPVEILSVGKDGKLRIHYIDYADSWDTDVEPDKLRPMASAKPGKK